MNRYWWLSKAFLYAGRIDEVKGVSAIITSWHRLAVKYGPNCPPLWVVGGTPGEIDILRASLSTSLDLTADERANRIRWFGYLDPPGLSAILLQALVLVHHARYEPGGRIVLEAMAEGVPVIATPHGIAADLINDWENGFKVSYGDGETLTLRMEHFIRQPLLRNALGLAAQRTALYALAEWAFLDVHCEVYEAVLHSNANLPETKSFSLSRVRSFERREFIPTYPFDTTVPKEETIRYFVERSSGRKVEWIKRDEGGEGSSNVWFAGTDLHTWVVKHPYTRFETRPIWDENWNGDIVRWDHQRFAGEMCANNKQGFVRFAASDAHGHLLLRPLLTPIFRPLSGSFLSSVRQASRVIRRFHGNIIHEVARALPPVLPLEWRSSSREGLLALRSRLRSEVIAEGHNENEKISLRLSWELLRLQFESRLSRMDSSSYSIVYDGVIYFTGLADLEEAMPWVLCHGNPKWDHFLMAEDDEVGLIDGDHIHFGWAGEDFAYLLCSLWNSLAERHSLESFWRDGISEVAETEVEEKVIISWAGLLTLEGILRNLGLLKKDRLNFYLNRWCSILGWRRKD